jgi:hypothetical protein
MKKTRAYKQGIVKTFEHPVLNEGQVVEIIFEGYDFYTVQSFITATQEKIKKEDLQIN